MPQYEFHDEQKQQIKCSQLEKSIGVKGSLIKMSYNQWWCNFCDFVEDELLFL